VRRALAQERITGTGDMRPPNAPVTSAPAARALAEVIRRQTVRATGGRTYSETDQFLSREGGCTSDPSVALTDDRTGRPVTNPDYELWIRSTTLQSALMQAYLAFRLADLTTALGGALLAAGAGVAAAARRP
jgi:hypothetical protein